MLKKHYLHRNDWKRIIKRTYRQKQVHSQDFSGYISLIQMHKVSQPLVTNHLNKDICIVDNGYSWLQQLPMDEQFAVTTMFNDNGHVVQWYIDITDINSVENDMPYMIDLFLDIIVLPTGETIKKDIDEFELAFKNQWISEEQYHTGYEVFNRVYHDIQNEEFTCLKLSEQHRLGLLKL